MPKLIVWILFNRNGKEEREREKEGKKVEE